MGPGAKKPRYVSSLKLKKSKEQILPWSLKKEPFRRHHDFRLTSNLKIVRK
jgi:hypothetical protein